MPTRYNEKPTHNIEKPNQITRSWSLNFKENNSNKLSELNIFSKMFDPFQDSIKYFYGKAKNMCFYDQELRS